MRIFLTFRKSIGFILLNFGAPLVFFVVFRLAGPKPAIAFAVVSTLLQGAVYRFRGDRLSPFYLVASVFTIGLGAIDLLIPEPWFFRFEPFAQNFLMGILFLASLLTRFSILGWFASGLPASFRPQLGPETRSYLRNLTLLWGVYLVAKAFLFLYLAVRVDLGSLILLRSIIGGGTLVLMVVGELIYRRYFYSKRGPAVALLPRDPGRSARSGSDPPDGENPSSESRCRKSSPRPR